MSNFSIIAKIEGSSHNCISWQISTGKKENTKSEHQHSFKIQCVKSRENAVLESKSILNF